MSECTDRVGSLSETLEIVFAGLQVPLLKFAPFALPRLWAGLWFDGRLGDVRHEARIGLPMAGL
jgi:hypothetical protein